ncbi:MAG TPA: bifunctional glutamate N-acetyltransferase/amino-acid acetyltransferase ArgJ [Marinospirillum sp.]|uniref:bifunctional glutamate N-acetyltransferase/amino-acid acetyltransferase ArgJ n=1 Tax=Marinospirillum sp. TaxID=2183934 RepID=UPI002B471851|nr:bifunctional glutamate N-acetyltransferase/amino-acid acetyltransferase ArgJ [Marinospirillum sp.]HKM15439.1 bifunctional glutamate N-acetyltransferase/amino-acid acetyltransferase ArgJ [Marinospirillum sp.]
MAVGQLVLPEFNLIKGLRIGTASAGIKKVGRKDLVVFELAEGSTTAGVFTLNAFCAAPVQVAREHLQAAAPRYLLINTGNANAGTGVLGLADAKKTCAALAELTQVSEQAVLPFSTGVIGEPLPMQCLLAALPAALKNLDEAHWTDAATGIMTTDTLPKGATASCIINGKSVVISGIAKGAGMIKPNMATMLGFIATDAAIAQPLLKQLLKEATDLSFNRITIDGDTSTNDSCMLVATAQAAMVSVDDTAAVASFRECLISVMQQLALSIVRDGEGATKFVTIHVEQAASTKEALEAAFTVAHSPLVKTALYASDANWGRILAAVGRAPGLDDLDVGGVTVYLGDVLLVEQGGRAASYTEAAGAAVMNKEEITLRIQLGRGQVKETVWTCDFSHDYVSINADYRS